MKTLPRVFLLLCPLFLSPLFGAEIEAESPFPLNAPVEIILKEEIRGSDILTGEIRIKQNGWLAVDLGKKVSMVTEAGERHRVVESEVVWIPLDSVARIEQRIRLHGDATDPDPKEALASTYFEAIMSGDAEKANTLVAVPFSMENSSTLKTIADVEGFHEKIVEGKGARPIPNYVISPSPSAPALPAKLFSDYVAYEIRLAEGTVYLYVSVGETPKLVGLREN